MSSLYILEIRPLSEWGGDNGKRVLQNYYKGHMDKIGADGGGGGGR